MRKQSKHICQWVFTTLFVLLLVTEISAQEAVQDTLALKIEHQPYLKLQEMVDCEVAFTTIEKRICTNLEFQHYNRLMTTLVNQFIVEFQNLELEIEKKRFIKQQQEWIEYRNDECVRQKGKIGNIDMISENHLKCLTNLTIERIEILESAMAD